MENLKGSEHYIQILYEDLYGYDMDMYMKRIHNAVNFLFWYRFIEVFIVSSVFCYITTCYPFVFHPCRRCLFDSRAVSVEMQVE